MPLISGEDFGFSWFFQGCGIVNKKLFILRIREGIIIFSLFTGTAVGSCRLFSNPLVGSNYNATLNPNNYCVDGFIKCDIPNEPICATPCDKIKECSNGYDESTAIGCVAYRECGQDFNLANGVPQKIESPGYTASGEYDPNNDCHWILTSPGNLDNFQSALQMKRHYTDSQRRKL